MGMRGLYIDTFLLSYPLALCEQREDNKARKYVGVTLSSYNNEGTAPELTTWISQRFDEGATTDQVTAELANTGLTWEDAKSWVEHVD